MYRCVVLRFVCHNDLPIDVQMTGRYVMGANELHIMRALEKAVQYFEKNHGLKI
jgi:hypothetical protein